MLLRSASLVAAVAALAVSACAGSNHTSGSPGLPPMATRSFALDGGQLVARALPPRTIGEELPSEGVGSVHSAPWGAVVGGFTQMRYAQVLAFPPGTILHVHNLSNTTAHTLDVVEVIAKAPARFPQSPSLAVAAAGHGVLGKGYASGIIQPGKSITVKLLKPGIYLIGCAFHYSLGMRDVLIVRKGAKPGPQGTPAPQPTATPSTAPSSSPPGGGW